MNRERINDYIDVYADVLELNSECREILKELIPNLVEKYSKSISSVSVEQDDFNQYIIKPKNNEYSLEDFFLNRLMNNVTEVSFDNDMSQKGIYESAYYSIVLNEKKIRTQLEKYKDVLSNDYDSANRAARKKVIMHEFEHALQTRVCKGYRWQCGETYDKILNAIKCYKDGKYANEINLNPLRYENGMNVMNVRVTIYKC